VITVKYNLPILFEGIAKEAKGGWSTAHDDNICPRRLRISSAIIIVHYCLLFFLRYCIGCVAELPCKGCEKYSMASKQGINYYRLGMANTEM